MNSRIAVATFFFALAMFCWTYAPVLAGFFLGLATSIAMSDDDDSDDDEGDHDQPLKPQPN